MRGGGEALGFEDIELLDDASKSLLGYFAYRWFRAYLSAVNDVMRAQFEDGLISSLTTPTERGRATLFDFRALDLENLEYLVGVYLYIYLGHKYANYRLMHRFDGKQVLYLRGYDVEGVLSTCGGVAAGMYTTETMQFGFKLREQLGMETQLFKIASPLDIYWETVDAQRYFSGDYEGMQRLVGQRAASVYLNANRWQDGVSHLLDRMDHYIAYVYSLSESALWELDQLDTPSRRERVTVVFDEDAIVKKEGQAGMPREVASKVGLGRVVGEGGVPAHAHGDGAA